MDIFLIVLGSIIFILILVLLIFDDALLIVWYILGKKKFRYHMIRRYQKGSHRITYLGTMHHMHENFIEYSYLHLKAVLTNLKPDLLLVESRPEELEQGNLGEGPLEMLYLHLHAREMGIPVKGIDYFHEKTGKPGTTNKVRDGYMLGLIQSSINEEEDIMVALGATHMLIHHKYLKKMGYTRVKVSKKEIDDLYAHNEEEVIFPKEYPYYIKKRLKREKEIVYTDPKWMDAQIRLIKSLETYLTKIEEGYIKVKKDK